MEQYTKKIACPEHKTSDHMATLNMFGHKYAGVWTCDIADISDVCEHLDTHHDIIPSMFDESFDYYNGEACDDCGVLVEEAPSPLSEMSMDCE